MALHRCLTILQNHRILPAAKAFRYTFRPPVSYQFQHQVHPIAMSAPHGKFNKKEFEVNKAAAEEAKKQANLNRLVDIFMFDGNAKIHYGTVKAKDASKVRKWAHQKKYSFVEILEHSALHPSYAIVTGNDKLQERHSLMDMKKVLKPLREKLFRINASIDDADLKMKEKHMAQLIKKHCIIKINIQHRKLSNDADNRVKIIFDSIISALKEAYAEELKITITKLTEKDALFHVTPVLEQHVPDDMVHKTPEELLSMIEE